jgi:hypothetical protein
MSALDDGAGNNYIGRTGSPLCRRTAEGLGENRYRYERLRVWEIMQPHLRPVGPGFVLGMKLYIGCLALFKRHSEELYGTKQTKIIALQFLCTRRRGHLTR